MITLGEQNDEQFEQLIASMANETEDDVWINAKMNKATEIQAEINQKKKVLPLKEQVPKEFHEYLDLFSEEKAARFPELRIWDHKIEMKDTFIKVLQNLQPNPRRTNRIGQILEGKLGKRLHPTLTVPYGISILLCKQER